MLSTYRIGRMRVPLAKLVEHPQNPNSRYALDGDEVAQATLQEDFEQWNHTYGPMFNDDVYCLTGVIVLSNEAPERHLSELRQLAASGGEAVVPEWVASVQVASGLHRWNYARTQDMESLRFELYTSGKHWGRSRLFEEPDKLTKSGPDLNQHSDLVSDVTCLLNGDDFKQRRKDLGLSLGHFHRGKYDLGLICKLHGNRAGEAIRRICGEDAYTQSLLRVSPMVCYA